jgi:hypothetical protein
LIQAKEYQFWEKTIGEQEKFRKQKYRWNNRRESPFYCATCDILTGSERQLKQHFDGKKHNDRQ